MNQDEAAVIAEAMLAADPMPLAVTPIPDGTYGGATFKGCWIEQRSSEAGAYGVIVAGEPIRMGQQARLDGRIWGAIADSGEIPGTDGQAGD